MTQQATTYITRTDRDRLENLIKLVRDDSEQSNLSYVDKLEAELEFAEIVAAEDIPPDIVTMRSQVRLKDLETNEERIYSIVFPTEANIDENKISVLAPLATAILGYRRGSTVRVQGPGRVRNLEILEILYQPESAGDLNS